mmetsp:Transcript_18099/g.31728  ORF Transcript_18099/g.31728 Transcript_18099/m.31728 type:complete len:214 (+) Transcript_18099:322-963(+)
MALNGKGRKFQRMLHFRRRSGILHVPHLPSIQAHPTHSYRPSSTSDLAQLGTSTHHRVDERPRGMARSGRELWHRSGTVRGCHLRCIQACPSGISCPNSKESMARSGRSRLLRGTQCQYSCPGHKNGSPGVCHLRCSLSCPNDRSHPKRPASLVGCRSHMRGCLARQHYWDMPGQYMELHHKIDTRHGHHQPNSPSFDHCCTQDPSSKVPQVH